MLVRHSVGGSLARRIALILGSSSTVPRLGVPTHTEPDEMLLEGEGFVMGSSNGWSRCLSCGRWFYGSEALGGQGQSCAVCAYRRTPVCAGLSTPPPM